MTATNIFYNFVGFRYSPPNTIKFFFGQTRIILGPHNYYIYIVIYQYDTLGQAETRERMEKKNLFTNLNKAEVNDLEHFF